MLLRYAVERLLYRLGESPSRDRFVLKGAVLFSLWNGSPRRPTRDVDFLAHGDAIPRRDGDDLSRCVCATEVEPDGLGFLAQSVRAEPIRDQQEYGGVRVTPVAMLQTARIPCRSTSAERLTGTIPRGSIRNRLWCPKRLVFADRRYCEKNLQRLCLQHGRFFRRSIRRPRGRYGCFLAKSAEPARSCPWPAWLWKDLTSRGGRARGGESASEPSYLAKWKYRSK